MLAPDEDDKGPWLPVGAEPGVVEGTADGFGANMLPNDDDGFGLSVWELRAVAGAAGGFGVNRLPNGLGAGSLTSD